MATRYKVTWQTEYKGKLGKDDDPNYYDEYRDAKQDMSDIIYEIKHNEYLSSDRQVVKLYMGSRLIDKWDSMPKRSQVMKARAKVKRNVSRRL